MSASVDQLNVLSGRSARALRAAVEEMSPDELFAAEEQFLRLASALGRPKYVCRAHAAVLRRLFEIYPTR
jgi:hypothetical protein